MNANLLPESLQVLLLSLTALLPILSSHLSSPAQADPKGPLQLPPPASLHAAGAFPGTLLPWPGTSTATMGGDFSEAAFLAPWQLGEIPSTGGGEKRVDA